MKLPAKIEYAIKAVFELSTHYHENIPVQISEISKSQKIPKKYLVQLLLRLKDAGIVQSARGVSGGYYLIRLPAEIKLADVFKAVDSHVLNQSRAPRPRGDSDRLIFQIWGEINQQVAERLEVNFENLMTQVRGAHVNYQI